MGAHLLPNVVQQFRDASGNPLSGGKLYSYQAGTSTPQATYTDQSGGTPNTNPTILDSTGSASIWLGPLSYKLILKDANNNVLWTVDNVSNLDDGQVTSSKIATGALLPTHFSTGAVQSAAIDDGAVGNDELGSEAVSIDKVDSNIDFTGLAKAVEVVFDNSGDFSSPGAIRGVPQFPWSAPVPVTNPTTLPAAQATSLAWSPNDEYLAVGVSSSPFLVTYQRMNDTFVALSSSSSPPTGLVTDVAWSPDGQFLALGYSPAPRILIYQRSNSVLTLLGNPATTPGAKSTSLTWSPNGEFLAVTNNGSPSLIIYQRSGTTFTKLANPSTVATGIRGAWSSSGTFLAFLDGTVYQRTGTTFTALTPLSLSSPLDLDFSRNESFLAVGLTNSPYIQIFSRSGTTFSAISNPASLPAGSVNAVSWSPNGKLLALGLNVSPYIMIYQRSGSTFTPLAAPASLPSDAVTDVKWSHNGRFLACSIVSSPYIKIYETVGSIPTNAILYASEVVNV